MNRGTFNIQHSTSNIQGRQNPHLTLTLSPPIRWERRGDSQRAAFIFGSLFGIRRQVGPTGVHGEGEDENSVKLRAMGKSSRNCNGQPARFGLEKGL